MKLHILSDLHLEFEDLPDRNEVACDVVVVAGDLDVGRNGVDWLHWRFREKPVIYVLGNHEFYRNALPELTDDLRRSTAGTNIYFLENSALEIDGWTFLGCTLWTNFLVGPDPEEHMRNAEKMMNDFCRIRNSVTGRTLRARDTVRIHKESVDWLQHELGLHDPAKTVVVTHHAPSRKSENPIYIGGPLAPAFSSNLDALIESSGISLWVHGHTHFNVAYRLGSTRVLTNQRGYPPRFCTGWNPSLVVEL